MVHRHNATTLFLIFLVLIISKEGKEIWLILNYLYYISTWKLHTWLVAQYIIGCPYHSSSDILHWPSVSLQVLSPDSSQELRLFRKRRNVGINQQIGRTSDDELGLEATWKSYLSAVSSPFYIHCLYLMEGETWNS